MLEAHVIQTKGFKNVDPAASRSRFAAPTTAASGRRCSRAPRLTVDGETFGCRRDRVVARRQELHRRRARRERRRPLGVRGAGAPHRRQARRPRARSARGRGGDHLALVLHPRRDAADARTSPTESWCSSHDHPRLLGVSLYSYGGDYLVTMTLEDCLADVADMGASGIEILADTHIAGYPNPTTAWIDDWLELVGRRLTPTCYSSWLDTRLHKRPDLTVDEAVPLLAARPRARPPARLHDLAAEARRRLARPDPRPGVARDGRAGAAAGGRARDPDRAGDPLADPARVEDRRGLPRPRPRDGTEHFGLLIDTGIFQTGERSGREHSDSIYAFGNPTPELAGAGRARDVEAVGRAGRCLVELMPYVCHVHAKFWDMTDDLTDPHVPYDAIVDALVRRRLPRLALRGVRGPSRPLPRLGRAPPAADDAPAAARRPVATGTAASLSMSPERVLTSAHRSAIIVQLFESEP